MSFKIVSDSSSNLYQAEGYAFVPLKIRCGDREYWDTPELDIGEMLQAVGRAPSTTSCPNSYEWQEAYRGADKVFAVTITSALSGCYSAAEQAKAECLAENPEKELCVIDSLSTGPEMRLIIEKLQALIAKGLPFPRIEQAIGEYRQSTHLLFCLRSLKNLARNGRVNPALAKIAELLGIRVVGRASKAGTLEQLHKCRSEARALEALLEEMVKNRFCGGRAIIAHCFNSPAAKRLGEMIERRFPQSRVSIEPCGGLCAYYAEMGGLIVGYEGGLGSC